MPTYEPFDWYETPLYYDIIFDADTPAEVTFLQAAQARYGRTDGKRMLEPACGSGRLVAAMTAVGYDVTGFDISEGSLRFARDRLRGAGLSARLDRGRMEAFAYDEPFDIAHCLVSTFRYLLDEDAARSHLECVAEALAPGGVYVLGLHVCDYAEDGRSRERWVAERDGVHVVCNIQSWPPERRTRRERVRSRMTVRRHQVERRFETSWTFRTYSAGQLRRLVAGVERLEHVATHDFGYDIDRPIPLDGGSIDNVLVFRKRG